MRICGNLKKIYNEAGYIEFDASKSPVYYFLVREYPGSTRAVVDISWNLVQNTDYYTGGWSVMLFGSPLNAEERMQTGKEFNAFNALGRYDNDTKSYDRLGKVHATGSPGREVSAPINGQSQTSTHELYGHGSLYINEEPHKLDTRGDDQINHNTKLLKKITNAVNETIENMEERNNAK